jgi:hypothetical protein
MNERLYLPLDQLWRLTNLPQGQLIHCIRDTKIGLAQRIQMRFKGGNESLLAG